MSVVLPAARASAEGLPIEMLAEIIEYVAPAERWHAASVSRDFRAAAHLAGFAIHYRLHWYLGRPIHDALAELSCLIARIARDNLRISLDFACCHVNVPTTWEKSLDTFLDIIPVVSSAMPFMTAFTATVPMQFRAVFDEKVLCLPAPNLRSLSLTQSFTPESWNPHMHPIPAALFAGAAAELRELSLFHIPLPADPIRVFTCVRTLHIVCNDGLPPMNLVRHFPALINLHTEFYSDSHGPSVDRVEQAFARLSLDSLTLDCARIVSCDPAIGRVLGIKDTRVVRLQGRSIFWEESLLGTPSGSLRARLVPVELGAEITVLPDHRKWRRVFVYDGSRQDASFSTLAQCPSFRDTLTYVRLDCNLVGDFLDTASELPALCELRIDMHLRAPSGYRRIATLLPAYPPVEPDFSGDPYYYVPCPALRTLTVFALDVPAEIDPLEAAHLGRALGQVARPKEERARLVLAGSGFTQNDSGRALLEQAFSYALMRPFAGRDSLEDRQCVMWGV